ncbi:hypothetical protein UB31_21275 [Bradyrhizobium sp. LTSP849]|uniref:DUF5343 domain-containing protein n=1 Tax=Bradyrhizobium sp. LTSP849 TaxID=1615890 RepID=UPI0005D155E0|nr:DUF5343 domain-containing protein [Bradyrhizobium sp. LTSP849]KJC44110.1 hypothetical protein UB31_21275 [Bradyrhizobium sp. LTSP849]
MNDKAKSFSPPYATFSAFISFINKLRETTVPSRVDPSVFGNASGSLAYSIIASLKYLKLINDNGSPTQDFISLVKASDDARPPIWKKIMVAGYPSLLSGDVDLTTITAGQFDEHLRKEYGVQGSTVDKVALFFVAGAKLADIPLSGLLLARKPVATSTAAKKSLKQRKRTDVEDDGEGDDGEPDPPPQHAQKALEYQLIDLMSEPDIDADVKNSIWSLVQYLTARKAKKASGEA